MEVLTHPLQQFKPTLRALAGVRMTVLLAVASLLPAGGDLLAQGSAAETTVRFYRLRVEFTTTSDWSEVQFKNPSRLLSNRLVSASGQATAAQTAIAKLSLNQANADALSGRSVGMAVEYALEALSLDQPLQLTVPKGAWNSTTVRISVLDPQPRLLLDLKHEGFLNGVDQNALPASVDLAPLMALSPKEAVVRAPGQRMLWAYYVGGYDMRTWGGPYLIDTPLTPYSCADREAIRRQIAQAQSAGIDGFIYQWWDPVGGFSDRNLATMLDVAHEMSFSVALNLGVVEGDPEKPLPPDRAFNLLAYLYDSYGKHPALYRHAGRPVFIVYGAPRGGPLAPSEALFKRVRESGRDPAFFGQDSDPAAFQVFDGLFTYGALSHSSLPGLQEASAGLARQARYYHLLSGGPQRLWMPGVQPGLDMSHWNIIDHPPVIDRAAGAYYRGVFEAIVKSDPEWIGIVTWNFFHENTHIEPSVLYEGQYLRITREFAERWKGKTVARVVNAASNRRGPVAPGEIVTLFGAGIGPEKRSTSELDSDGKVANVLAGTRVWFDDVAAPLLYTQAAETGAVVPYAVAGKGSVRLQVESGGARSNTVTLPVAPASPAIFTVTASGIGQVAAVNEDGVPNSVRASASRNSLVTFYATGEGQTRPPGVDGKLAGEAPPRPDLPVSITIGGAPAEVVYAGGAPGVAAGLLQLNVRIPDATPAGVSVPVVLTVGGVDSRPGTTLAVEHSLSGAFELADAEACRVSGWVDISGSADAAGVRIYRDGPADSGALVANLLADRPRPDLPLIDRNRGFERRFPGSSGLYDGQKAMLFAYALDSDGTPALLLDGSPRLLHCGSNQAGYIAQSVPQSMIPGSKHEISVTLRNAGSRTWIPGLHALGSLSPRDNRNWGTGRIPLPGRVLPGETVTIRHTVTAPSQPGSYGFQWQMVESEVGWFGDEAPLVNVSVAVQ